MTHEFKTRDQKLIDSYAEQARNNRAFIEAHTQAQFTRQEAVMLLRAILGAGK